MQSPDVPLLMDMDEATFAAATVSLLESGNDVRLRQFIRALSGKAGPGTSLEEFTGALDKWTVFCAQTLYFDRPDLVDEAIDKLCELYKHFGIDEDATRRRFTVVVRIYVIGALAVRLGAWATVHSLTLRPVPSSLYDPDYIYSSWIRNATVFVARANLHMESDEPAQARGGFVLSAARNVMVEHPAMRPDLTEDQVPTDEISARDAALNSLRVRHCLLLHRCGDGGGHGSAYPSSSAFDEDRSKPMAQRIVADANLRGADVPGVPDTNIAAAIAEIYELAIRESASHYGGRWWAMPPSVDAWVGKNSPPVNS